MTSLGVTERTSLIQVSDVHTRRFTKNTPPLLHVSLAKNRFRLGHYDIILCYMIVVTTFTRSFLEAIKLGSYCR